MRTKLLERIRDRLQRLSDQSRLAYGLICSERMLPNYARFEQDNDWGDGAALRESLDLIWDHLLDESVSLDRLGELRARCEAAAPDTDEFRTYVSHGLDAAAAIAQLLDFVGSGEVEDLVAIASLSFDTVDMFLRWRFQSSYEGEIASMEAHEKYLVAEESFVRGHELILEELAFHKAILEAVSFLSGTAQLLELRNQWSRLPVGSIRDDTYLEDS